MFDYTNDGCIINVRRITFFRNINIIKSMHIKKENINKGIAELHEITKQAVKAAKQASVCLEKHNADIARIAIKAKECFDATIGADLVKIQKNVKSALEDFNKAVAPNLQNIREGIKKAVQSSQSQANAKRRKH